jgi:hypothetical protein
VPVATRDLEGGGVPPGVAERLGEATAREFALIRGAVRRSFNAGRSRLATIAASCTS